MPEVQSNQSVNLANTHPHGDIVGDVERIASRLPLDEFYIGDISAGQIEVMQLGRGENSPYYATREAIEEWLRSRTVKRRTYSNG